MRKPCGEWLYLDGIPLAVCVLPYGTEHSHSDHTATEAVTARRARHLTVRERASVRARLEAYGFYFRHTGGNCTAYVRDDGQVEEWVTVDGTHSAPSAVCDVCTVAVCETGEDFSPETQTATCGEILTALELGDNEYSLLYLKLHNGHHKKGSKR